LYGVSVSASTVSKVTDKVQQQVSTWQNRPLAAIYPIIYLDAIHLKIRRDGKVSNTAVYVVLAVDLEGRRDILGHWIGDGGEGANFWLSVVSDLQSRGVEDVFIACVDGLAGFSDAIGAVFPQVIVQRCIVHQIRNSLRYVSSTDQKAFMADLKTVYKAATRAEAEVNLLQLGETWSDHYAIAVRSWENNWEELAAFFDFPAEIRRAIYTTNAIEGYNRQLRKVIKTKGAFPSPDSASKLLFLAQRNIAKKWTKPILNWPKILNQLAIRFDGRFPI
jgi:transposase-like protein